MVNDILTVQGLLKHVPPRPVAAVPKPLTVQQLQRAAERAAAGPTGSSGEPGTPGGGLLHPNDAASSSHVGSSSSSTSRHRDLTFSSAPAHASRAAPMPRASYSHTRAESERIHAENGKLGRRIEEIGSRRPEQGLAPAAGGGGRLAVHPPPPGESRAAATRRRQEQRVAQENLALFKRLQSVKPSTDVSREALSKHATAQRAHERIASRRAVS